MSTSAPEEPVGPPPSVQRGRLSRYIFSRSQYAPEKKVVKPSVFTLPSGKANLSVYQTEGLEEREVWDLGERFVAPLRPELKPVKARADLHSEVVTNAGLLIKPTTEPHPRHANLERWPSDPAEQKAIGVRLANEATLVLRPLDEP